MTRALKFKTISVWMTLFFTRTILRSAPFAPPSDDLGYSSHPWLYRLMISAQTFTLARFSVSTPRRLLTPKNLPRTFLEEFPSPNRQPLPLRLLNPNLPLNPLDFNTVTRVMTLKTAWMRTLFPTVTKSRKKKKEGQGQHVGQE